MAGPRDTRARILAAAIELFAERGYSGTSIGEIEAAAGLAPRSGGLYKHFASKDALLEAALSERLGAIEAFNARLELEPLGDLRAELTLTARWGLAELARERQLVQIVMRDGGRVPELAERFHATIVRPGIELTIRGLQRYAAERGAVDPRPRGARRGRLRLAGRVQPPADPVRRASSRASTRSASSPPGSTSCLAIIENLERSQVHA